MRFFFECYNLTNIYYCIQHRTETLGRGVVVQNWNLSGKCLRHLFALFNTLFQTLLPFGLQNRFSSKGHKELCCTYTFETVCRPKYVHLCIWSFQDPETKKQHAFGVKTLETRVGFSKPELVSNWENGNRNLRKMFSYLAYL